MFPKPYISRIDRIRETVKKTKSPVAFAVLGRVLLKENKKEEAKLVLKFSYKESKLSAFFYCKCLMEEGKPEEAKNIIEDIVAKYPTALGVRKLYADILNKLGEREKAKEQLNFINCFIPTETEEPEEIEIITPEIVEALITQCMFDEAKEKLLILEKTEGENEKIKELKDKIERYMKMLEPER